MTHNKHIRLIIISTTFIIEEKVEWVEVDSPTGSFFVGMDHSPLVSLVKKRSILRYKPVNQEPTSFEVGNGGISKIEDNEVAIVLDQEQE